MLDLTLSLDGGAVLGGVPVEGVPSSLLSLVRDGSDPLWVGLRPEDVEVDTDEQARMVAAVHVIEPHGNETLLILRLVDTQRDTVLPQSRIVVRADPHVAAQLGTGARIRLALDWQKALIFDAISEQRRYLKAWQDSGNPRYFDAQAPLVRSSHGKLIAAYNHLMRLFGEENPHNKQAFFDHLCALDFI